MILPQEVIPTTMGNFECKNSDKYFQNKVKLDEHHNLHCDICGEICQSILQQRKHEYNSDIFL